MAGIVQVEENNLINGWLGIAAYTAVTGGMKLALATVTGTSTTAGTEVAGGSYARAAIVFSAPSAGATSNNALISFTGMPATTVTGIDIYDSAGTPIRRAYAPLAASKTTGSGDTISFSSTAISASLS
jgi:hypothetical protein